MSVRAFETFIDSFLFRSGLDANCIQTHVYNVNTCGVCSTKSTALRREITKQSSENYKMQADEKSKHKNEFRI